MFASRVAVLMLEIEEDELDFVSALVSLVSRVLALPLVACSPAVVVVVGAAVVVFLLGDLPVGVVVAGVVVGVVSGVLSIGAGEVLPGVLDAPVVVG